MSGVREVCLAGIDRDWLGLHGNPHVAARPCWSKTRPGRVNLSSNELLHPNFDEFFRKFLQQCSIGSGFSHYSNVEPAARRLEELWDAPEGSCQLAPGADPAIGFIFEALGRSGRLVAPVPCYRAYPDYAAAHGLDFIPVDALRDDDLGFSRKLIAAVQKHSPCLVSVTNPDGVTGRCLSRDVIEDVADACLDSGGLMILDEAYSAFATADWQRTWPQRENCVKLRTFSKSHGTAGIRLAAIIAPRPITDQIAKTRVSHGVSCFALSYLEFLIANDVQAQEMTRDVMVWRTAIESEFRRVRPDWIVSASHGNFVFVDTGCRDACSSFRNRLDAAGIRARFFPDEPAFQTCARLTVAPPEIFTRVWPCLIRSLE
jgi:histidinol-phosphate aminotransferase